MGKKRVEKKKGRPKKKEKKNECVKVRVNTFSK